MTWSDVFIRRPVLALVVSLVIMLLGVMGYGLLGVQETPDVVRPVVTVGTSWPGADPAIVESDLTEVLERELNGIEGVVTLSSTSQEGSSSITVEFDLDRDLEAAANDVRSRVARARRRLPQDVDEPVVEKSDASAQPMMFLRLTGEGRSLLEITEIGDTVVRDRLENIEGVSGVDLMGAQTYAMRIELDAVRMAARGVTVGDVEAALRAGNVDLPAGRVEGASTQLTIHLEGGLATPDEFGALVVRARDGARVYLRDVARVRLGAENERTGARADGIPSISVALTPQAKANIIAVSDEARSRLAGITADLPAGMSLDLVYDRADTVRTSIHDVELTLGVAFLLVVAVIFAFLRDWRSTLVPAVAIPVSVVGTFLILWMAGFTINVFTLFGLVLAIGLVVDDAIVVLENIVRRIEAGEPVMDAAILGTRQIAVAVVATTVALVAVFLPVIFTGGATGRLFLEFGVTVAASVGISMVVALSLTPMLCSRILRPASAAHHEPGWLARVFAASLGPVMRRPWVTAPVVLLALGGVYAGFQFLPREFFPTEDRNMFILRLQAQEGTSFAWMDARVREVEQELMPLVPERRVMLSRVATGPGGTQVGTNSGMILFPLVPRAERERSQQEIVAAMKGPLSQVTAFRTIPVQFPTVGRGFSPPLQFVLQNPSFEALVAELPRFLRAVRELPGLTSVNEDLRLDRPELWVHVDRERAAELGLPLRDVARTLQVLTSGLELSTFKRGVRQYKVIASLPPEQRAEPSDLGAIFLRAGSGELVPLSNVVRTDERAGAASRFHYNRAPSATISANVDGITLGEGIARVQALAERELPEGFRTALAGESRDYAESSSSLAQMFLLALALVYLLLAAQFDSFLAPVSIMLSVPLALAGAFAGLQVLGMPLSFFGQVGLILLVGLVTKNGILIVEYARQLEHDEGLDPWKAAEAAARLRFRPILMTSVATIGGALPIAVGLSGASRASLGVAVVGGMLTATLLTLYVTPITYAALASLGRRRRLARAAVAGALALLVVGRAEAAPLTLGETLRLAVEGNLALKGAATEVDAAEAGVVGARADLLPTVAGSATAGWSNLPAIDGPWADASVRAEVPLVDLPALADARAAARGAEAARAGYDAAVEGALYSAGSWYVALQQAEERVVAAEAGRVRAERLARLAQDRVDLGAASRLDLARAQLALKQEEASVLAARTAAATARVRLAEQLGLPLDAAVEVVEAAPVLGPEGLPADVSGALDEHPEVRAARARLRAAEADRQAAAAAVAPRLGAWGEVGAETDLAGTTLAPVATVGVAASVPIWAGGARAAATDAARAGETAAALTARELERAVEAELRVALGEARDGASGLEVAAAALELAREELERAESLYRAGAGDNLAVVTAQAALAQAEGARVDALAAYNRAVLRWYAARGELRALLPGG